MRIGIVNISSRFDRARGAAIQAWFDANLAGRGIEVVLHPDSFGEHGHFGGDDPTRANAFVQYANDPAIDAVWFTRGGYGACRIVEAVLPRLTAVAAGKRYLGYSDVGSLLAGMYKAGIGRLAHGPLASDVVRGDATAWRAVNWLATGDPASWEDSLHHDPRPAAAFNLSVLGTLMGTYLEPDLTGHVVMIEDVSEPLYRIDRMMFHLTAQPGLRRIAGLRLGRVSDVVENDPAFADTAEEIARYWCERSGIAFLGHADIGHDADNKVVPFGPRG